MPHSMPHRTKARARLWSTCQPYTQQGRGTPVAPLVPQWSHLPHRTVRLSPQGMSSPSFAQPHLRRGSKSPNAYRLGATAHTAARRWRHLPHRSMRPSQQRTRSPNFEQHGRAISPTALLLLAPPPYVSWPHRPTSPGSTALLLLAPPLRLLAPPPYISWHHRYVCWPHRTLRPSPQGTRPTAPRASSKAVVPTLLFFALYSIFAASLLFAA